MMRELKIIPTVAEFRAYHRSLGLVGGEENVVGFVPTMGALHEGHASLVRAARAYVDTVAQKTGNSAHVVASIFVNPTQFVPGEDYSKYPRTLEADAEILQEAGCDAVFVPSAQEMYPGLAQLSTKQSELMTSIDPGPLGSVLEGAIRPGHFRGVCTVVAKLLLITQPTYLFMGQKDFQQQLILRHMITDLNLPVELVRCPTIREADGLAMSSRNRYLSPADRQRAVAISRALFWAQEQWRTTRGQVSAEMLREELQKRITEEGLAVQYAAAYHAQTLEPWAGKEGGELINGPCVLLVAAKLGTTRLIDNLVLVE